MMTPSECKDRHRAMVWSNPDAPDAVWIRAALLQPRFGRLLDFARAFGIERLRSEWNILVETGNPGVEPASAAVERILNNISVGFSRVAHAATRN